MMNPADVSIRPVDGGFFIEWLELKTPDREQPQAFRMMGVYGEVHRREAVRGTMKDALKLVESVLKQKEMLRKAGKLDIQDDGRLGGTGAFLPPVPPGLPP